MTKTLSFFLVAGLVFIMISVNAQNASSAEYYTIKKGDTLWDISDGKLEDNFLWPNVWRVNPQINNPDLIYPGNRIRIPSKEELLRLPSVQVKKPVKPTIKEVPVTKVPVKKPKYIVDKNRYISSGWISDGVSSPGKIFSSPSEKTLFGSNDLVYLKTETPVKVGNRFFTIRYIKEVLHPETKKFLGHQIRITGILNVIGMDGASNDVPIAKLTTVFEDVQLGDLLLSYREMEPPTVPDSVRTPDIKGYIVESHSNARLVGMDEIIYIDKGQNDGLKVGDAFSSLFSTPVERSTGMIQIISLQPTTATAIVLKSRQDISIGDMWGGK